MPKLYYTPHSCGAANFISAWTGKVNLECEQVNLENHTTSSGVDYYTINPKGNVPCLVFEDGMILNENGAVLQWIGDHAGVSICPPSGSNERYMLQNCLNYLSSEVHQSFGILFHKHDHDIRHFLLGRAHTKLTYLEKYLIADREFLVGTSPTIVDFYLYILLRWHPMLGVDLTPFPKTKAWFEKMDKLPTVMSAKERMATNPTTVVDSSSSTTTTMGEKISAVSSMVTDKLTGAGKTISEIMPTTDAENKPPINN